MRYSYGWSRTLANWLLWKEQGYSWIWESVQATGYKCLTCTSLLIYFPHSWMSSRRAPIFHTAPIFIALWRAPIFSVSSRTILTSNTSPPFFQPKFHDCEALTYLVIPATLVRLATLQRGFSNMNVTSSVGVVVVSYSITSDLFSKGVEYLFNVENESEGYYGNLNLLANAPYQDEPSTVHGQPTAHEF